MSGLLDADSRSFHFDAGMTRGRAARLSAACAMMARYSWRQAYTWRASLSPLLVEPRPIYCYIPCLRRSPKKRPILPRWIFAKAAPPTFLYSSIFSPLASMPEQTKHDAFKRRRLTTARRAGGRHYDGQADAGAMRAAWAMPAN